MNSKQFEFDAVVAHLYAQGRPAFDDTSIGGPGCYYRQPNSTNKCAVGCRIPDDVYVPEMDQSQPEEGTGIDALIRRFGNVLPPEIIEYRPMFSALQTVHDGEGYAGQAFNLAKLAERLKNVAHSHGVVFNEPKQAA